MNDIQSAEFQRNSRGLLWGGLALAAILSAFAFLLRGNELLLALRVPPGKWNLLLLSTSLGGLTALISILLYECFPVVRQWFPRGILQETVRTDEGVHFYVLILVNIRLRYGDVACPAEDPGVCGDGIPAGRQSIIVRLKR